MATLTEALKEAYASAPEKIITYHTIELRHPSFTEPVRVVRDLTDLVAALESNAPANPGEYVTFIGCPFEFSLPGQTDQGQLPEIEVTLDAVTGELITQLDLAIQTLDQIEVTYRPYVSSDLSAPHMDPPLTMTLRDVQVTGRRMTGRAGFDNLQNERFPKVDYTTEEFPGLAA